MSQSSSPCVELRVARLAELRAAWLDEFVDGGLFVPGAVRVPNGARIAVRVSVDELPGLDTILDGVVAFRHAPIVGDALRESGLRRAPGAGVAFDAAMRPRIVFLERAARGVRPERLRRGARWPMRAYGELLLRPEERAREAEVVDVGPGGAQIALFGGPAFAARGEAVRLWVAFAPSGESSFAPLSGRVAWRSPGGDRFGVSLDLGYEASRIHWERVVARARAAFEAGLARPTLGRIAVG